MVLLMALLVPVFLGATALAVDIAIFHFQWAQLQKAADAAALAGAGYLPGNPTQAISAANSYATLNGIKAFEITSVTVGSNNVGITVALTRIVAYYFGRVLGLTTQAVSAKATAGLLTTNSVIGVIPVGIDSRTTCTFGEPTTLVQGDSSIWTYGPGNWGALAPGGSGASNFETDVINGYTGRVSVGDWVSTEPGMMAGPLQSGFNAWISNGQASDPSGTISSHTLAASGAWRQESRDSGEARVRVEPSKRLVCAGQSAVEFALVVPVFLLVLVAGITLAVIGHAALAVSQLAYNGARYAAVNPQLSASQACSYITSGALGSPTITGGGGVNLTCSCAQATFGNPVTVTVSYNMQANALVSGFSSVFAALGLSGMIPSTLTATESAMSE